MSNDGRDQVINNRLMTMIKLANDLSASGWRRCEKAENDRYIRINGDGYQAVSLADDQALCGYGKSAKSPKDVIANFDKDIHCNGAAIEKKRERRLQAYLIKQSLSNKKSLLTAIPCLSEKFDDLIFVTDEISFGDKEHTPIIRIDIFAIGKCIGESVYVPVCIELKHVRSMEIVGQLEGAVEHICGKDNKADRCDHIEALIKAFVGSESIKIDFDKVKKVIVWPEYSRNGLRNIKIPPDIILVEYYAGDTGKNFTKPSDIEFVIK